MRLCLAKAVKADIDRAHRRLLQLQSDSVAELKLHETSGDASAIAKRAMDAVEGKPYPEALFGLLSCAAIPDAQSIKAWARRAPLLTGMMGVVRINAAGKAVAIREGVHVTEDGLAAAMIEKARASQLMNTQGAILPAREVFNASFPMRLSDLEALTFASEFVPQGRERTFARGLHAGFIGDWSVVAHLLPPQIEHSLRMLFEADGIIVSGLRRSVQHENDINKLLSMQEADRVVGPDLRLDLQASLANGFGSNVRNYMAHGLFDDDEFQSAEVVYVWWQALRLICMPQMRAARREEANQGTGEMSGDAPVEGESSSR